MFGERGSFDSDRVFGRQSLFSQEVDMGGEVEIFFLEMLVLRTESRELDLSGVGGVEDLLDQFPSICKVRNYFVRGGSFFHNE